MFSAPFTISAGTALAVFFFPPSVQTSALGEGGGRGIGVRAIETENASFYPGANAQRFVRFDPAYELGVEPIEVMGQAVPQTLARVDSRRG